MITLRKIAYLATLLSIAIASAKIITPKVELKNPVCIFDVGRVLISQSQFSNTPDYFSIIKESDNKLALIKPGLWCMFNILKLRTMNLQGPEDAVVDYIAQKFPILHRKMQTNEKTIAERAKEVLCSATPIKETQKIVADLIEKGYPVALGSNKGKNTIARMIKSGALADLEYALIFTCDSHKEANEGIFYKKPDMLYYKHLKEELYENGFVEHSFIFIDNDLANVEAACKAGMTGILYTTPEELIADLQQLGIKF